MTVKNKKTPQQIGKASKRKGARFELEIAHYLQAHGYPSAHRTAQHCGKTGDACDVEGIEGLHVECKHVEKLNLYGAYHQAVRDSSANGNGNIPVVILYRFIPPVNQAVRKEIFNMINGKLEFCRDDFRMYRTLEAQLAFYQRQLSELRDNYLVVDTVNDYRSGQAHTVTIETVQQTAYARSRAQAEAVILDLTQKIWIIRRTVDLATGCTEAALQAAVAMYIYNGTELDKIARLLFVSRPTVSRYIKRFFELPEVKKLFYQAVEDSKGNLRDLKH